MHLLKVHFCFKKIKSLKSIKMYKFLLIILILGSCSQENQNKKDSTTQESNSVEKGKDNTPKVQESKPLSNIEVKTFPALENTFGYEIWIDGQKTVVQSTIPSVPGNKGFATEEKARKVADLVVSKIKNNQMPPSITPKELDSLGVLK